MKGQRRHELEKNELADWLAKVFGDIGPYQNAILGAVLLLLLGGVGYLWWAGQSAGKQADASDALQRALWELFQGNPSTTDAEQIDHFEAVVENYPDTGAAPWARVVAGDLHLNMGCNSLFINKGVAQQELREAVDHYRAVLAAEDGNSALRQRATFGLARALESQGDLQKATERYEELAQRWPDGAYAATAASRLEDLKRPATRLLYDRFAKFDPKPVPASDGPSEPPAFDLDGLRDDEPLFEPKMPTLQETGVEDNKKQEPPETPTIPSEPAVPKPESTGTDPGSAPSTDTGATEAGSTETGTASPAGPGPAEPAPPAEPPAKKGG